MADLSQIELNNVTYNLKDTIARSVIPWGTINSASTNTIYTATVPNVTELVNGTTIILVNNKVTSAANCTLNINNLGAKPIYMVNAPTTRVTTQFQADKTWMFIYNENRVENGCWDLVYLYDTDSNTTYTRFANLSLGNAGFLANSVIYRYQLLFQMNESEVTPLNNVSNNTNTNKTMLANVEFDPFGGIYYYAATDTINQNARVPGNNMCYAWDTVDLRYTFNCGTTLTSFQPVYLQVTLQSSGKVKIVNTSSPIVQQLPTINDGYFYIYLGRTFSTYQMILEREHPIFYYDGTNIREYIKPERRFVAILG